MVAMPRLATLLAVAGGAGIGVGTMALLYYRQVENVASNSNFVSQALEIVKEQPVTKELLGESIKMGKASFDDGWLKQHEVKLRVSVKGDNDNALLYAYARRKDTESKFRLYKLEATFSKIAGKKLVLLDRTDKPDEPDEPDIEESGKTKDKSAAGAASDNETAKANATEQAKKLTPEEAKQLYIEQMKSWQPVR